MRKMKPNRRLLRVFSFRFWKKTKSKAGDDKYVEKQILNNFLSQK